MKFIQLPNTNMSKAPNVIEQIVNASRRTAMLDDEQISYKCTIGLNETWALSILNNAHDNDDLMEGSAMFEVAVVKNGRSLRDEDGDMVLIDIRYNLLLYVLSKSTKVSSLLFNLEYWSTMFFTKDIDLAHKSAERLLRLAENA